MRPTILFVDDDAGIRDSFKRVTRRERYRVLTAESAEEAVNLLAVSDIHVLISDLQMPGVNGKTLVEFFRHHKPGVIRIVLSGHLDLQTTLELVNTSHVFKCLEKPCGSATLVATIHEALSKLAGGRAPIPAPSTEAKNRADTLTSLVHDAVNEVERLDNALSEYREGGRPIPVKSPYDK